MTKAEAILKFKAMCSEIPAEKFPIVWRYNLLVIDFQKEKEAFRMFFNPGKCRLIFFGLKENEPKIFDLTDEEHDELKAHWRQCAKVKFTIAGWRDIPQHDPQRISPAELHGSPAPFERIFFVQNKSFGNYLFTTDPLQATKFDTEDEARRIMLNLPPGDKVELIEIGVGAN